MHRLAAIVAFLVLLVVVGGLSLVLNRPPESSPGTPTAERVFADRRSDVWLEAAGLVQRELPDDTDPPRHQRFILELDSGHTVLVAHNIDVAGRIPLAEGDRVTVRGEYEWNERGGVIHWTHRDERGNRDGGWVRRHGIYYR